MKNLALLLACALLVSSNTWAQGAQPKDLSKDPFSNHESRFENDPFANRRQPYFDNFNSAPKSIIPRGKYATIVSVPQYISNDSQRPYWIEICRTNSPPSVTSSFIQVDGDQKIYLESQSCSYVAFTKKIGIMADYRDDLEIQSRFLGRY